MRGGSSVAVKPVSPARRGDSPGLTLLLFAGQLGGTVEHPHQWSVADLLHLGRDRSGERGDRWLPL